VNSGPEVKLFGMPAAVLALEGLGSFQQEPLTPAFWHEVQPLLSAHWVEIATHPDITLDPIREKYESLQASDLLRIYTARDRNGNLIGYAVYIVGPHLHYRDSLCASQDVLFVAKHARHGSMGTRLITYADNALWADGVQNVFQHVKVDHDFGRLLERLGYTQVEKIYAKRLDKE
jgi:hypothetical protein